MLPDRVSNTGPLTYESGALPIALRGPATCCSRYVHYKQVLHRHEEKCLVYMNHDLDDLVQIA